MSDLQRLKDENTELQVKLDITLDQLEKMKIAVADLQIKSAESYNTKLPTKEELTKRADANFMSGLGQYIEEHVNNRAIEISSIPNINNGHNLELATQYFTTEHFIPRIQKFKDGTCETTHYIW